MSAILSAYEITRSYSKFFVHIRDCAVADLEKVSGSAKDVNDAIDMLNELRKTNNTKNILKYWPSERREFIMCCFLMPRLLRERWWLK